MKRDIDSWINEIDLASGCKGSNFYISNKCSKLIKSLIEAHNDGMVEGDYYFHEKFEKKYPSEALTYKTSYAGMRKVHNGRWEFNGEYNEDYFKWIDYFLAYFHTEDGSDWIVGHNRLGIIANNETMYIRFMKQYKPESWDFMEI